MASGFTRFGSYSRRQQKTAQKTANPEVECATGQQPAVGFRNSVQAVQLGQKTRGASHDSDVPTIVRGTFHQGDLRFPASSRGRQCTANAAVGLGMQALLPLNMWAPEDIDNILAVGDKLYRETIVARPHVDVTVGNGEYLTADELNNMEFELLSVKLVVRVMNFFSGHLTINTDDEVFPPLSKALMDFATSDGGAIFTCRGISVAVFSENSTIWMFDPHARDMKGRPACDGRASLVKYPDVGTAVHALLEQFNLPGDDLYAGAYQMTTILITSDSMNEVDVAELPSEHGGSIDADLGEATRNIEERLRLDVLPGTASSSEMLVEDEMDVEEERLREDAASIDAHAVVVTNEACHENPVIQMGRIITDFTHVWNQLHLEFDDHDRTQECYFRNIMLVGFRYLGLKTLLIFQCNNCLLKKSILSEPENGDRVEINEAAAAGCISTGIGHTQLQRLLTSMDVKCMDDKTYLKRQNTVHATLRTAAEKTMKEAGAEERRLAIANGRVKNGIPCITVVTDASWMQRSYKTGKFDSPSGVGTIIGSQTNRVLYSEPKNKCCAVCDPARKRGVEPREHECFKNWGRHQSSSSMESDAILRGFQCSVQQHGLIYDVMIADGDSSVYKRITDEDPYREYDVTVKKIECKNHLVRNTVQKVKKVSEVKGRLGKIRKMIKDHAGRFPRAIQRAIEHRKSQNLPESEMRQLLEGDIRNIPSHIFGDHSRCAVLGNFCEGGKPDEINVVPELKKFGLWRDMEETVSRLAQKVDSLTCGASNNIVESFNAVVAAAIGGKRVNYSRRNSYNARCLGSVVSFNTKRASTMYSETRGKGARMLAIQYEARLAKRHALAKKRRDALRATRERRRAERAKQGTDKDYGPNAQQPDLSPEQYANEVRIHQRRLTEMQNERDSIQSETMDQWRSMRWSQVRRDLLTASNFGKVCNMRRGTSCKNIVTSIRYPNLASKVPALEWGRNHEKDAREELERQAGVKIQNNGLFVDPEILGLGATPDGLIDDDGIVEIKCPFSARNHTPDEAIQKKIGGLHRIFTDATCTKMNPKHEYYHQVQGQLHVTRRDYCLFTLWTPHGAKVVRVHRDDDFWDNRMKHRLIQFYEDCLLPEIVDGRHNRNMPIRDPPYVVEAQEVLQQQKQAKLNKQSRDMANSDQPVR